MSNQAKPTHPSQHPQLSSGDGAVDRLCDLFESRLASGELVRCEQLILEYSDLFADPESAIDLIYREYMTRRELGETVHPSEYYDRFPQFRKQLEEQFALDQLLEPEPSLQGLLNASPNAAHPSEPRYRVGTLLAKGGIGQVMRALDTELHREVAVKEIQPVWINNDDLRERFLREAEITGRLEHPGIVPIYGLCKDPQGVPYYAMRLVRGQSFFEAIEELHSKSFLHFDSIDFQKLMRRFLSVCETIAFAHSRGVVHRDIKPQNILLGPYGETLVVDWGLAKATANSPLNDSIPSATSPTPLSPPEDATANWSVDITQASGAIVGSPAYMSPEQARGDASQVGPWSDIYSLGATLHTLLTGRTRFGDSDVNETLQTVIRGDFPFPRDMNRSVPQSLDAICRKAMAINMADRYASARELAEDIEHYLADEPITALAESPLTTVARWTRRNRGYAIGTLGASILIAVVTSLAAMLINGERIRADAERIESRRQSARLAFDRGYQLVEDQQYGEGVLWFNQALQQLPMQDRPMRRVVLTNMAAAKHRLGQRIATIVRKPHITHMQFSPDGKQLLLKDDDALSWWDIERMTLLREHSLKRPSCLLMRYEANGDAKFVLRFGRELLLQSFREDDQPPEDLSLGMTISGEVDSIDASVHFEKLIMCCRSESPLKAKVIDVNEPSQVIELKGPSAILQVAFLPKTLNVALVSTTGIVSFFQWDTNTKTYRANGTVDGAHLIHFTPDGKTMIGGTRTGLVRCWDVATKKLQAELGQHVGQVTVLTSSSDSRTVAAGWDNGVVRAWNMSDRRPACETLRFDRHISNIQFRPGTHQLLILAKRDTAHLWSLPDPLSESIPLKQTQIDAVDFSNDGRVAVTASRDGMLRLRNGVSGDPLGKPMLHKSAIKHVSMRPDGKVVLSASLDGTARLWDAVDGSPFGKLLDHRIEGTNKVNVLCGSFSPDGRWVATGDSQGAIYLWDANTGEKVSTLKENMAPVLTVCFSPDSRSLLAGYTSTDNGVRMWDIASGVLKWKMYQRNAVRSVAISPDGRIAMSAGNDETARFWDPETGQPIGPELQTLGEVFVARFSPDSRLAVTAGYDATIRLWEVSTGIPRGEPMRHESIVLDVAFSPDGQRLISCSADHSARIWDVTTCLPLSPPLTNGRTILSARMNPRHDVAFAERLWKLPVPLPDRPDLVLRWTRLATQRDFMHGQTIEWLDPTQMEAEADQFSSQTGMNWQEWSH